MFVSSVTKLCILISFRILHYLSDHELNPFIFHLVNLILHVLVSCLTFQVYNLFFEMRCPKSSLCCALMFAIHPVHTESVCLFLLKVEDFVQEVAESDFAI